MVREKAARFLRFLAVGALGFVVDITAFTVCLRLVGLNFLAARLTAFAIAMLSTWLMNRTYTFADQRGRTLIAELGGYMSANLLSSLLNLATYTLITFWLGTSTAVLYGALACGVGAGLAANYVMYSKFVFRTPSARAPRP